MVGCKRSLKMKLTQKIEPKQREWAEYKYAKGIKAKINRKLSNWSMNFDLLYRSLGI
jgi:hypothetical protein